MNIIVLGAGLIGAPIAKDLAQDTNFNVSIADKDPQALDNITKQITIQSIQKDLSDRDSLKKLLSPYDLAINAVPGSIGYRTLKTIIESKKNVVDIAFSPENTLELNSLAQKQGVTAVVDCGMAPGMSNILVAHAHSQLDTTKSVSIFVGGLPEVRIWPYEYKAGFSPSDVIEEYTRPAYIKINGKIVCVKALSDCELIDFPEIGTLEAFNTDGLRSLLHTMDIPNMKEKTLRYPGHAEKMKILRDTGFFNQDTIDINGKKVRPMDVTSRLLLPKIRLEKKEKDITIMKVKVVGTKNGRSVEYIYDLFDRYDEQTETHSMARTTGYTATSVVRLLSDNRIKEKGIIPPERIGIDQKCVKFILSDLKKRGVLYKTESTLLDNEKL